MRFPSVSTQPNSGRVSNGGMENVVFGDPETTGVASLTNGFLLVQALLQIATAASKRAGVVAKGL